MLGQEIKAKLATMDGIITNRFLLVLAVAHVLRSEAERPEEIEGERDEDDDEA
jgi:hypothetical protein